MPSYKRRGEIPKARYSVSYLGWKECRGLAGREFTEPIVKDLVIRRKLEQPLRLTLEVSSKELKIYQMIKGKLGRTEKLKFPTVPTKDVTYAAQGLPPDDDVVACIYVGYNPTTRRAVHVHVYRFDSPTTANAFADHLIDVIRQPEHEDRVRAIEADLTSRGEIAPRPRNFIRSYDMISTMTPTPSGGHTPSDVDDPAADRADDPYIDEKEEKMESLAAELKQRLGNSSQSPLLLPPQDYDTVRRVRGNMNDQAEYEARKCKNQDIVGAVAADVDSDDDTSGNSGGVNTGLAGIWRQQSIDPERPTTTGGQSPVSPRWSGSGHPLELDSPVSARSSHGARLDRTPSPRLYRDLDQPPARNPARSARPSGDDPYIDESQYLVPYPAGSLPPPGFVGPAGVMSGHERLPRQLSTESSSQSDHHGNNSPRTQHPRAGDMKKDKKKKKTKKGEYVEEPPPDYTLHPANVRKLGALYA